MTTSTFSLLAMLRKGPGRGKDEAGSLKSTYTLISEPLLKIPGWKPQSHLESGSPYLYMRATTEGRVIVGGEDEAFVNAKRRDTLISQKTRTLVKKFERFNRWKSRMPGPALLAKRKTASLTSESTPGFHTPVLRWVTGETA